MRSYWHFCALNDAGKPVMRDGTPVEVGKRYEIDGDPILCKRGYHGSLRAIDALRYASGPWVSKRPLEGVIAGDGKVVGRAYVQQPGIDAAEILSKFARMCALDVIHMWDAPEIVVQYLKTGDDSLRAEARATARAAARAAAWDSAWAEARGAARAAARAAARDSAWATARDSAWGAAWATARAAIAAKAAVEQRHNRRLTRMLNEALKEADNG